MKNPVALFKDDTQTFLHFLKSKYPLFHDSNVFFRDIHFGVMGYLEQEGISMSYSRAEKLTHQVIGVLEEKGILKQLDGRTWLLQYPEFRKPPIEKKAAAAPAAGSGSAPAKTASGPATTPA